MLKYITAILQLLGSGFALFALVQFTFLTQVLLAVCGSNAVFAPICLVILYIIFGVLFINSILMMVCKNTALMVVCYINTALCILFILATVVTSNIYLDLVLAIMGALNIIVSCRAKE